MIKASNAHPPTDAMFSLPLRRRTAARAAHMRLDLFASNCMPASSPRPATEGVSRQVPLAFETGEGRSARSAVDTPVSGPLTHDEWITLFSHAPAIERGAVASRLATLPPMASRVGDADLLAPPSAVAELHAPGLPAPQRRTRPLEPIAAASPFVAELLRGYGDRAAPVLIAGYVNGESLLIDFKRHELIADDGAWAQLRAQRELPRLADGAFEPRGLTPQAKTHDLDALVWSCGLAAGALPLLDAPDAWRHARIVGRSTAHFRALSRVPVHLHLADLIAAGDTTPEHLRRATRVDLRELRAFLQAGLFVQALQWAAAG
jgi:hypothetical protein